MTTGATGNEIGQGSSFEWNFLSRRLQKVQGQIQATFWGELAFFLKALSAMGLCCL